METYLKLAQKRGLGQRTFYDISCGWRVPEYFISEQTASVQWKTGYYAWKWSTACLLMFLANSPLPLNLFAYSFFSIFKLPFLDAFIFLPYDFVFGCEVRACIAQLPNPKTELYISELRRWALQKKPFIIRTERSAHRDRDTVITQHKS